MRPNNPLYSCDRSVLGGTGVVGVNGIKSIMGGCDDPASPIRRKRSSSIITTHDPMGTSSISTSSPRGGYWKAAIYHRRGNNQKWTKIEINGEFASKKSARLYAESQIEDINASLIETGNHHGVQLRSTTYKEV